MAGGIGYPYGEPLPEGFGDPDLEGTAPGRPWKDGRPRGSGPAAPPFEKAVQASQTQSKMVEMFGLVVPDTATVAVFDVFPGRTEKAISIVGFTVHESSLFPFPAAPARLVVELHVSPSGVIANPPSSSGSITIAQWVWDHTAGLPPSFIGWDGTYPGPGMRFVNVGYPVFVPNDSLLQIHAYAENVGSDPIISPRLLYAVNFMYPARTDRAVVLPPLGQQ